VYVAVYVITVITQLLIAGYGKVRIVFGMADAVDWSESSAHLITVRSCFPLQMLGRLFSSKTSCSCAFSAAIRASDTDHLFFIKNQTVVISSCSRDTDRSVFQNTFKTFSIQNKVERLRLTFVHSYSTTSFYGSIVSIAVEDSDAVAPTD
jgi:hypothetical protein